jgi:hypothetical protein
MKDMEQTKLPVGAMEGDLEFIANETLKLSKGDVLISTVSFGVEKEISEFKPGFGYPIKRTPVIEVSQVFSSEKEYTRDEFVLKENRLLELKEKPENMPKQISIVYSYNPSYRVGNSQEYSGLSGKVQLRQYIAKPDTTNLILSDIRK